MYKNVYKNIEIFKDNVTHKMKFLSLKISKMTHI